MAWGGSYIVPSTLVAALAADGTRINLDLSSAGTGIYCALFGATVTPAVDTDPQSYGVAPWNADEVTGTGWSAGGVNLSLSGAGLTHASGGFLKFTAGNVSVASTTISTAVYGCLLYDTSLSPKAAVCAVYFGGSGYTTGEAFTGPRWGSIAGFPGWWGYFDNEFEGSQSGPDWTSLRDPSYFTTTCLQPPAAVNPATGLHYVTDTGSVKASVCNQYNFSPDAVPISSFTSIRSYRNKINPDGAGVNYDSSWDIYGYAHSADTGYPGPTTLEVMFWTYYHGTQHPANITNDGQPTETGIDFGDGQLWDLYMTASTKENGGVSANYSYGIYCLSDISGNGPGPSNPDTGWIDILAGLRYFTSRYVVTSNGAPADPLDIRIWQIIEGWEVCSTNYAPLPFTHLDSQLELS